MENKVPGTQVEENITSASNSKIRQVNLREKYVAFPTRAQHDMDMSSILMKFGCLRVLDAGGIATKDLPSAVGNLKHLRYLNLSRSEISTLPDSLCCLWNLQILNLYGCRRLVALPKNVRYLTKLRHLCLESCTSLREMPTRIGELTCLKTLSLFIVGRKRGNRLEELQFLNLGGKLEIQHLERVENHVDANKANLAKKKNLRHLSLVWQCNSASKLSEDKDEKVLEALEPHRNIETLKISGFTGKSFPVWMTKSTMENIVQIDIKNCPSCRCLLRLGELPHLKVLSLENLMMVEYFIEDEVEGGNPVNTPIFPSLETLRLRSLPNLKGLLKEQMTREVFPNLWWLVIERCSSLILPPLSSLQKLEAWNCSSLTLASFSRLDTLTTLKLILDENMKCIPIKTLQNLTNLRTLEICNAHELSLPEEGLRALKSVTYFRINESETLTCLPDGWLRHLTALEYLIIYNCRELSQLPEEIKHLHNLQEVWLQDLPKMVSLPKALQHLSWLTELSLLSLPELQSLPDWLDHLTSLRSLHIDHCPKLASLPPSIQALPNLQYLSVRGCPALERRCERRTGEEWHNIAHIPHLYIWS